MLIFIVSFYTRKSITFHCLGKAVAFLKNDVNGCMFVTAVREMVISFMQQDQSSIWNMKVLVKNEILYYSTFTVHLSLFPIL